MRLIGTATHNQTANRGLRRESYLSRHGLDRAGAGFDIAPKSRRRMLLTVNARLFSRCMSCIAKATGGLYCKGIRSRGSGSRVFANHRVQRLAPRRSTPSTGSVAMDWGNRAVGMTGGLDISPHPAKDHSPSLTGSFRPPRHPLRPSTQAADPGPRRRVDLPSSPPPTRPWLYLRGGRPSTCRR